MLNDINNTILYANWFILLPKNTRYILNENNFLTKNTKMFGISNK